MFRENEGQISWVSQFRKTSKITKEKSFAKHENRENEENLSKNTKFNYFSFNACEDAH